MGIALACEVGGYPPCEPRSHDRGHVRYRPGGAKHQICRFGSVWSLRGAIHTPESSQRVGADHFAAGAGAQGVPGEKGNTGFDESDRSIQKQQIGAAGVE